MEINRIHVLELEQDNTNLQAFQINDANETVENAFAYGTEVEAIAPSSQAFGTKTQAGCLGYYISAITKNNIYLSREKVHPKVHLRKNDTPEELANENAVIAQYYQENFNSGLPNGTFICHVQANEYYQWPFITVSLGKAYNEKTNSNRLSYDYMNTIPQSSQKYWFQDTTDPSHDQRSVQPHILYCLETPMAGVISVGTNAHAEGSETLAAADDSHAEGCGTRTAGRYAHAEGKNTEAGFCAHAEGINSKAQGFYSHAEGYETEAKNSQAHAEGYQTMASGKIAHAEGCNTIAEGFASHAEGRLTKALGESSHAEGRNTIAEGFASHASGFGTIATKTASHVIGRYNERDDKNEYLFIIGNGVDDKTRSNAMTVDANGNIITKGSIRIQKADGTYETLAKQSEIVNAENFVQKDKAVGRAGNGSSGEIFNDYNNNKASNQFSHAEGYMTIASGFAAHAEGNRVELSGNLCQTKAIGTGAHAEGIATIASGRGSHAEGVTNTSDQQVTAQGEGSHAEGLSTYAKGKGSHTEGEQTIASKQAQHVQGKYNEEDNDASLPYGKYAHIVGNGTSSKRSNAHTIDWDGNAWYKGRIQCGGTKWDDNVVGRVPCVFTNPPESFKDFLPGDLKITTINTTEIKTITPTVISSTYKGATTWYTNVFYLGDTGDNVTNNLWITQIKFKTEETIPINTTFTITSSDAFNSAAGPVYAYLTDQPLESTITSNFMTEQTDKIEIPLQSNSTAITFNSNKQISGSTEKTYALILGQTKAYNWSEISDISIQYQLPEKYCKISIYTPLETWQQIS